MNKTLRCKTEFCRNKKKKGNLYCSKCITRKYRKNNPLRTSYQILKDNAKRRNKEFQPTFEEFKTFCTEYKYLQGKGKYKEHFTIDRIDNDKGYTIDNIQILNRSENSKKGTKLLNYQYGEDGMEFWVTAQKVDDRSWDEIINEEIDDNPFI